MITEPRLTNLTVTLNSHSITLKRDQQRSPFLVSPAKHSKQDKNKSGERRSQTSSQWSQDSQFSTNHTQVYVSHLPTNIPHGNQSPSPYGWIRRLVPIWPKKESTSSPNFSAYMLCNTYYIKWLRNASSKRNNFNNKQSKISKRHCLTSSTTHITTQTPPTTKTDCHAYTWPCRSMHLRLWHPHSPVESTHTWHAQAHQTPEHQPELPTPSTQSSQKRTRRLQKHSRHQWYSLRFLLHSLQLWSMAPHTANSPSWSHPHSPLDQ